MKGTGDWWVREADTLELTHITRQGVDNAALALVGECAPELEEGVAIDIVHDYPV